MAFVASKASLFAPHRLVSRLTGHFLTRATPSLTAHSHHQSPGSCVSRSLSEQQPPKRYSVGFTPNDEAELANEINTVAKESLHDREFKELTIEMYESIIKCDEDRQLILKVIDDYEFTKYCSSRVPTTITPSQMGRILTLLKNGKGFKSLQNFFNYLFKCECARVASKRIRKRKAQPYHQWVASLKDYPIGTLFDPETFEPIYRKWHNSPIMRVKPVDLGIPKTWERATSSKFAPDLIIDMSFTSYMDEREQSLAMDQLSFLYGVNSNAFEPFNLLFCNYDPSEDFDRRLRLKFPNLYRADAFIQVEKRSYLDFYPKSQLIYLTPDAPRPLVQFDNDILIIGCLVDKTFVKPLTNAKARMEGIRTARLPLDEHIIWGKSTKSLTLNQVVSILCKFRETNDWREALLCGVPKRKIKSPEQVILEEEAKRQKYLQRKRLYSRFMDEDYMRKEV